MLNSIANVTGKAVEHDLPLLCKVEDDHLVFRIKIETLALVAGLLPRFYEYEKHGSSDPPWVNIIDPTQLAHDICNEINNESPDGSGETALTGMLDDAILSAFENGSTGFSENN